MTQVEREHVCAQRSLTFLISCSAKWPVHYLITTWLRNMDKGLCDRWNIQLQAESWVKLERSQGGEEEKVSDVLSQEEERKTLSQYITGKLHAKSITTKLPLRAVSD